MISRRFEFVAKLGSGAMGEVSLSRDTKMNRYVAIKKIRTELAKNEEFRKRLKQEILLHSQLNHPNIVVLYEVDEVDGDTHLIMEYVEGNSLAHFLQTSKIPWTTSNALKLGIQVLSALEALERHDIIHRDIKPANILIELHEDEQEEDEEDEFKAKLTDFGIARAAGDTNATTAGGSAGTPLYMAPEMVDPKEFGELGFATDMYAVGILLYECISGAPPFIGSPTQVATAHTVREPEPLTQRNGEPVSAELQAIISKALCKQPSRRFQRAREFRKALEKIIKPSTISTDSGDSTGERDDSRAEGSSASNETQFASDFFKIRPQRPEAETRLGGSSQANKKRKKKKVKVKPVNIWMRRLGKTTSLILLFGAVAFVVLNYQWIYQSAKDLIDYIFPDEKTSTLQAREIAEKHLLSQLRSELELQSLEALDQLKVSFPQYSPRADVHLTLIEAEFDGMRVDAVFEAKFEDNFDDYLWPAVYMAHVELIDEEHHEALSWLSVSDPSQFTASGWENQDWELSNWQESINQDYLLQVQAREDFEGIYERNDAKSIERKFGKAQCWLFRDVLTDPSLRKYLVALKESWDDVTDHGKRLQSYQLTAKKAQEAMESALKRARALQGSKGQEAEVRRLLRVAENNEEKMKNYRVRADIQQERYFVALSKKDWLTIMAHSYAAGQDYITLATDILQGLQVSDNLAEKFLNSVTHYQR